MRVHLPTWSLVALFLAVPLAGCLGDDDAPRVSDPTADAPAFGYLPPDPDATLGLVETDHILEGAGVELHVRVVRPEGAGPFPVIAQFTPYTAPGQNTILNQMVEPVAGCHYVSVEVTGFPVGCEGGFDRHFARRGYAFAYGDVRGTGDSTGCLDLRGDGDIADLYAFTRWLGTQDWSNGNVGFIGASYPGSEAHMAGIANAPHLKAIVPIVASTSFYHYHHNDGVPYSGQHSLGGTNTGYTRNALMPTVNPHNTNYAPRYVEEASQCETKEQVVDHGGLDQTGAYYDWWQERNLRERAKTIEVPVLMAQGLADWNVKPDHIATWFNDLPVENKVLIAGQWGHAYPYSVCGDGPDAYCDDAIPYGQWWQYVNAFFDTFLKEVETDMFEGSVAWVQDSTGTWHRSADWPLLPEDRDELVLHLRPDGGLGTAPDDSGTLAWYGCPDDEDTYGHSQLRRARDLQQDWCEAPMDEHLVFESEPFTEDVIVSGVPLVELTLESEAEVTHLVAILEVLDANGDVVSRTVRGEVELWSRENYGYLNPIYRNGLDAPEPLPDGAYQATIDLYPQEDVVKAGERLRLTLASDDSYWWMEREADEDPGRLRMGHRTVEAFAPGVNTLLLDPENVNRLLLPLRPSDLQGVRLPTSLEE